MKKKDIQFNPDEFLNAAEEIRDHVIGKRKITLRSTKVKLPPPAPEMTPDEIAAARESLNVSQPVFARLLNVPTVTAASWEKGRRKPSGAALRICNHNFRSTSRAGRVNNRILFHVYQARYMIKTILYYSLLLLVVGKR